MKICTHLTLSLILSLLEVTCHSQVYKIFIFSFVKCLKVKRNNLHESTDKEVSFLKMGTSQNFVTDSNARTALSNLVILSARDKVI